jgi:hypothetical protein
MSNFAAFKIAFKSIYLLYSFQTESNNSWQCRSCKKSHKEEMDILEKLFRHQEFGQVLSAPWIVNVIVVESKEASVNEK